MLTALECDSLHITERGIGRCRRTNHCIAATGNGHAWCSDATTPSLSAVGDAGEIWVLHEAFGGECCQSYDIGVATEGDALNVTYDATSAGPCDCDCGGFTIEYVLGGVAPGEWTVHAGNESDAVVVP